MGADSGGKEVWHCACSVAVSSVFCGDAYRGIGWLSNRVLRGRGGFLGLPLGDLLAIATKIDCAKRLVEFPGGG